MYMNVTVTANAPFAVMDYLGLEAQDIGRGYPFVSASFNAGDVKSFQLTESQWSRMRAVLDKLAQTQFLPQTSSTSGVNVGTWQSVLTYVAVPVPGSYAGIEQVKGAISLGSATNAIVLNGQQFIRGNAAVATMGSGTSLLTLTAARKGPEGNNITVTVGPATAGGAVVTTVTPSRQGWFTTIVVTPVTGSLGANAIASQIAANALAATYITATGGGTATVPQTTVTLTGGEGGGQAYFDFINSNAERLHLKAVLPGTAGNQISFVLSAASGAGSVTVSGTKITVVPAAAGNTVTAVVAQIVGNASAAALVLASGTGTHAPGVQPQTWLHGGSGDTPAILVGSEVVAPSAYSDTAITFNVDGTALSGYSAGDFIGILLTVGFARFESGQAASA
jgi:hypothetical protein